LPALKRLAVTFLIPKVGRGFSETGKTNYQYVLRIT